MSKTRQNDVELLSTVQLFTDSSWVGLKRYRHLHLYLAAVLRQTPCGSIAPPAPRWGEGSSGLNRDRPTPGHLTRPLQRAVRPPWGTGTNDLVDKGLWVTRADILNQYRNSNKLRRRDTKGNETQTTKTGGTIVWFWWHSLKAPDIVEGAGGEFYALIRKKKKEAFNTEAKINK